MASSEIGTISSPAVKHLAAEQTEMHIEEEIRFVCPNLASDYIAGVLKLPKKFCLKNGESLPERVLLHVPPGVVWNGIFKKESYCIEGVEKLMSYFRVKPYHMVLFEYMGGPSFNLKIFNPYSVEINYNLGFNSGNNALDVGKSVLETSEIEVEKLCCALDFNAYKTGRGLCEIVVRRRHLRKTAFYKVLKRNQWESLGLVETMGFVKFSFKKSAWVVNLKWQNGKLYMDRMWLKFARASKLRRGDTIIFQKTDRQEKFVVCVFERNVLSKCNLAGIGNRSKVMDWFKIANFDFIRTGEMEIPRVFTLLCGVRLVEDVNLILRDGETVVVKYCPVGNRLFGMRKLVRLYSIKSTNVMIFTYIRPSTFVLSIFKISGMESNYNADASYRSDSLKKLPRDDIILLSDSSDAGMQEVAADNNANAGDNNDVEAPPMANVLISFKVILKKSHVDKRQHGVYCPSSLYDTYRKWTNMTTVRLICGAKVSFVSVLRRKKICRFGKGWSEFTVDNELEEGQMLQLDYVDDFTFHVAIVS